MFLLFNRIKCIINVIQSIKLSNSVNLVTEINKTINFKKF